METQMLKSKEQFNDSYLDEYNKIYTEAKEFVENPEKLRLRIDREEKNNVYKYISPNLPPPKPDQFMYRMIRYKGFVKYPERLKNFIVSKNQKREENILHLPIILDIEPNSTCNFRCTMCQLSGWMNGRRALDLCYEDFKKLIDDQYGLTEVKLQGIGEPLLHKDYFKMVEYLVDKYIWVRTTVNGSMLHRNENYKKLVDSGVNEVQTSFDGATKSVFERIRVGSNFGQVVENLTMLNDYANNKRLLITRMWVLLQKDNRHQLLEFAELAKQTGFKRLTYSIALSDFGQKKWSDNNKRIQTSKKLTDTELEKLQEFSTKEGIEISFWNLADKYDTGEISNLCGWPFTRAYVSSDLKVVPCCMIANPDIINFGEAKNFTKTWNNESIKNFRRAHLEGKIPEFCRNCYL